MQKTLIIAEAGVNHNGSMELAKRLIDSAANAEVDYIKFQTFRTEKLVTKQAQKADYQIKNTGKTDDSQFEMLKKLELSPEQHYELMEYCKKSGVKFFSTAFDLESIDFLARLNLGIWKIPSGEITNYPFLKKIATKKQPTILSTGMSTMDDIRATVNVLKKNGLTEDLIAILHCNTQYPTPMEDVNLRAMFDIKEQFGVQVGYSDHTYGIEVPIAAVALGATIIEKHFTLDRTLPGPDHKASLEPNELKAMVQSIRNIEKALGDGVKKVSPSEQKNKEIARKSIVASKKILKGELFSESNLTVKRPGNGISPMEWEHVVGKIAKQNFETDDLIEL